LLMMAMLGLGMGVITSALTTRYRDLTVLVTFGVQLLMYLTPIVYPLSTLPEPYRSWMALNPIAPIVELFRHAYLGAGVVSMPLLAYSAAVILVVLFFGIALFNRVERTFMDTV
jgi:lipopolysaccharide transport system permease protein